MICLFTRLSYSEIVYTLAATELFISGTGIITKEGVLSKGSVSQVTRVTIEEGPEKIDDDAFSSCIMMEYINIPKSVTTLSQPFTGCPSIKQIVVNKENPKYMNDENFIFYTKDSNYLIKAPAVKNIPIMQGVKCIQKYAFLAHHFNYGDIVFPSSLTTLDTYSIWDSVFDSITFQGVTELYIFQGFMWANIGTLTVPSCVQKITLLHYATIGTIIFEEGSNLESIESNAFQNFICTSIVLPNSLKTIKSCAFKESSLETITIGTGCSSIDITAFTGCQKLTRIEVVSGNSYYNSDDGILKGDKQIFFVPSHVTTITIAATVTELGQTTLQGASSLKTIVFNGDNKQWSEDKGVLYSKDFTSVIAVCGGVENVDLNSAVKTISDFAVYGCKKLTHISLTNTQISTIGNYAFSSSALTSFDLPNSVTSIGTNAFEYTGNLTTFNMNNDSPLASIPYYCFSSSSIASFTFGKNVVSIIEGAFYWCTHLTEISFPPETKINSIGIYAFEFTSLVNVVLPKSITILGERFLRVINSLETVIFEENSQLTTIPRVSFQDCPNLWKVVLPNSCKTLGSEAFKGCSSLSSITHRLEIIGSGAFEDCTSLETFTFTSSQTNNINSGMFKNCRSLKYFNVERGNSQIMSKNGCVFNIDGKKLIIFPPGEETAKIPSETVEFADNAFAWSPKLTFVAFYSDTSLTTIGMAAFYECKLLTTVQFPAKLSTIKSRAFYGCESLKTIVLPPSLTAIENGAFVGCSKLRSVKYCGTNIITGESVFESTASVLVTDLYPSDYFCNNKASKKLSYDCELKQEYIATCKVNRECLISSTFLFSLCLFIC